MQLQNPLNNINTLRYFATLLLVSYHVIGADEEGGMHVGYPSVLRFFADGLIDLRMPIFAFIAGAVYALRPLTLVEPYGFFIGKFRRIVVPGVAASIIFWVSCNWVLKDGFAYGADPIATILLSEGHFWFLQAILLIFLVIGGLDVALKYNHAVFLFFTTLVLTVVWKHLQISDLGDLEIGSAVYLSPYFLLGLLVFRYHEAIMLRKQILTLASMCLFLLGITVNISIYQETGQLSKGRLDLQSLSTGIGVILLAYFMFRRVGLFDRLAVYSFTIYLYHPFGTSLVRRLTEHLDISAPALHLVIGVTAGLIFPCLLHIGANRFDWSRRVLLGLT